MDILLRLRVLIWVVIVGLWGIMVYQYLGDEEPIEPRKMSHVPNPYKGIRAPLPPSQQAEQALHSSLVQPTLQPLPVQPAPTPEAARPLPGPEPARTNFMMPVPPRIDSPPLVLPTTPAPEPLPAQVETPAPTKDLPIPPGFTRQDTRHFTVFAEGAPPSQQFIQLLENLHGNLMLDLAAFSPWAMDQRVTIILFRRQDTYRRVTGRPAWSAGATSVKKRKVYVYQSEELPGILAHELTHIYYDGFFSEGRTNPLWLSEGMATLVQVERGLAAPVWLRENLVILRNGGGYALSDLMRVTVTARAQDAKVRLWYTQSYSVVRYMLRSRRRSAFYNFSQNLRDGMPVQEALYRAYGAPYTSVKALEHAWRYDLQSGH